jgi:D-alanyl-lipoteichoic acid acyltransferase DltB (MBOAT superfamily)
VLSLCRWTGLAALGACGVDHWDAAAVEEERTDGLDVRAATHRPPADHTALHLLAYSLYPPLMVAGPIVSFNAFVSQLSLQISRQVGFQSTFLYTLRWAGALVLLEAWLHAFPVYAVNASRVQVCEGLPVGVPVPADLVGQGSYAESGGSLLLEAGSFVPDTHDAQLPRCHHQLMLRWLGLQEGLAIWETSVLLLWLKFVVLWRFFRGVALWDGIVCEENQAQCVWMTSSIAGFWKGWHRSFNRWIVRYMYIPMGGARSSAFVQAGSGLVVFVFVALWHEFSVHLLVWGFVFGLLSAPEIIASRLLHNSSSAWAEGVRAHWLYPLMTACQGVVAVYILIFGNLLGFSSGLVGAESYFQRFASWRGLLAWGVYTLWHVCAVQITSTVRAARGYDVARPPFRAK